MEYVQTNDTLKDALTNDYYWQLYAKTPARKVTKIKLSRSSVRWTNPKFKDDLYIPSLRIVGKE
jgi:hypothetical protein